MHSSFGPHVALDIANRMSVRKLYDSGVKTKRDTEELDRKRFAVLADLISRYEAEHGAITDAELATQERSDRRNAIRPQRR